MSLENPSAEDLKKAGLVIITEKEARDLESLQEMVEAAIYYRNLSIILGAKPNQMRGPGDRELCERGFGDDPYSFSPKDAVDELMGVWGIADRAEEALERVTEERDEARAAAKVQNKACAEEISKREGMEKNWDQMVRSVKEHYEAQIKAETKLHDALAACAEMRGELQAWACETPPCANRCPASVLCERTKHALTDAEYDIYE